MFHWARERSSSRSAARCGSRCRVDLADRALEQRLGAAVVAVVDERLAGPAQQLDAVAAGLLLASDTRDHRSSARSSSAPASPWA